MKWDRRVVVEKWSARDIRRDTLDRAVSRTTVAAYRHGGYRWYHLNALKHAQQRIGRIIKQENTK